jgi:hypothetical protein
MPSLCGQLQSRVSGRNRRLSRDPSADSAGLSFLHPTDARSPACCRPIRPLAPPSYFRCCQYGGPARSALAGMGGNSSDSHDSRTDDGAARGGIFFASDRKGPVAMAMGSVDVVQEGSKKPEALRSAFQTSQLPPARSSRAIGLHQPVGLEIHHFHFVEPIPRPRGRSPSAAHLRTGQRSTISASNPATRIGRCRRECLIVILDGCRAFQVRPNRRRHCPCQVAVRPR